MGLMTASSGLTKRKLALATATPDKVSADVTYYAGDKMMKTGTLVERGASQYAGQVTNAGSGSNAYIAFGKIPEGIYRANGTSYGPEIRASKTTVGQVLRGLATATKAAGGTVKGDNASSSVTFKSEVNGIYFACLCAHASSAGTITLPSGGSWLWHTTFTDSRDGDATRSYAINIGIFRTSTSGSKTVKYQIGSNYGAGAIYIAKLTL